MLFAFVDNNHTNVKEEEMRKYLPWTVLVLSFAFFAILATRTFSWWFVPDSGDWLASAHMWLVPQPVGYPLYVLLGHFLNALPGDLVLKLVLVLSCLSSAITVALTYLISLRLTGKKLIATACAILLTGSAVFLTQSTIIEQYALLTCLLTTALWFFILDKKYLVAIFLGLAISVHVFALIIALLWFVSLIREWRQWWKPAILTAIIIVVFYSFVLLLMYLPTPRLLAGGLNIASIKMYLFGISGGIVGTMSIFEAPHRFLMIGAVLLTSFSVALIPAVKALRPLDRIKILLLCNILFILWYVLTCIDPITWHYLIILSPSVVILAALGLAGLSKKYVYVVLSVGIILLSLNSYYLNANRLTNQDPMASSYYDELMSLPNNSIVVTEPGQYSLGLFYAMSNGKQLIPLIYPYIDTWKFVDYSAWLASTYDIKVGDSTISTIQDNLGKENIYYVGLPDTLDKLQPHLALSGVGLITQIEGVR